MKQTKKHSPNGIANLPVVLTSEEKVGLQRRWESWQRQRARAHDEMILAEMAQEAYVQFIKGLRTKYDLPVKYNVDFDSGIVTSVEDET